MTEPDFFKKERYFLPEQWIIDKNSHHYATYFGSYDLILNLCPKSAKKVLDVGCGPGRLSYELIKKGYEVTGIDYSSRAIEFAKIMVPEGKFYVLDLTNKKDFITFESSFDIIILREVLEHIDPKYHNQILDYLFSLLDKDRILILTVPTKRVYRDPQKHYKHFDREEIVKLLEEHNFKVDKIIGNIRYDFWYKLMFNNKLINLFDALLAPPLLSKAFNKIYMKFFNQSPLDKCGRLIICSAKSIF